MRFIRGYRGDRLMRASDGAFFAWDTQPDYLSPGTVDHPCGVHVDAVGLKGRSVIPLVPERFSLRSCALVDRGYRVDHRQTMVLFLPVAERASGGDGGVRGILHWVNRLV